VRQPARAAVEELRGTLLLEGERVTAHNLDAGHAIIATAKEQDGPAGCEHEQRAEGRDGAPIRKPLHLRVDSERP